MTPARTATRMVTTTMPAPTSASGLRANDRMARRCGERPCNASPSRVGSSVPRPASVIADPRVEQAVREVDDQVDDHVDARDDEQHPLDQVVVALLNRAHDEA